MHGLLWFAAGCTLATVVVLVFLRSGAPPRRRHRRGRRIALPPAPAPEQPPEPAAAPEVPGSVVQLPDLEGMAAGIAGELANLASGIEGHAQLVIESADRPELLDRAAERLWTAVRRLRRFNRKLLSFSRADHLQVEPTDIERLLGFVRAELEDLDTGIKVGLYTAPTLPLALTAGEALKEALVFLASALLRLELFAAGLSLHAYTRLQDDHDPVIEIEMQVDLDDEAPPREGPPAQDPTLLLDYVAARHLLEGQGAHLSISHVAGVTASVLITLPATARAAPIPGPAELPPPAPSTHRYGGVLLLEDDPSIRAMLAAELKASGRNVLACSDGAAAHSLLAATPERFELLILDQTTRLDSWDRLASTAIGLCPGVKVCLLTQAEGQGEVPEHLRQRVRHIRKPFGLSELRATLRTLLQD